MVAARDSGVDRDHLEVVGVLTDFLNTKTDQSELATALKVVREFRECESGKEWLVLMFDTWYIFEMFQNLLEHLVENKPLDNSALDNIEAGKQWAKDDSD